MLSANKARLKSQKREPIVETRRIEKHIKEAIQGGHFCITRAGELHPNIKKKLERLGYRVEVFRTAPYGDRYYRISWD